MTPRLEVQGLRAVAVFAVLLYHLWDSTFKVAFLGVDMWVCLWLFLLLITFQIFRYLWLSNDDDFVKKTPAKCTYNTRLLFPSPEKDCSAIPICDILYTHCLRISDSTSWILKSRLGCPCFLYLYLKLPKHSWLWLLWSRKSTRSHFNLLLVVRRVCILQTYMVGLF